MKKLLTLLALLGVCLWSYPGGSAPTVGNTGGYLNIGYGITDTVGSDRTLEEIYRLKRFVWPGTFANTYYFDPYEGNDTTGTGTAAAPWQSLSKALTECVTDTECVFAGGKAWSPSTYELSGASGTFLEGEILTVGGEKEAIVVDYDATGLNGNPTLVTEDLNWRQIVDTGGASGGSFTLSYRDKTTAAIAFDATDAQMATALKNLTSIADTNGVVVTGSDPWEIEFVDPGDLSVGAGFPAGTTQKYDEDVRILLLASDSTTGGTGVTIDTGVEATDAVVGSVSGATGTLGAAVDTLDDGINDIVASSATCGSTDLCVYLRSSDEDDPAIFNCDGTGNLTNGGLIRADDDADNAWVGVENINVDNCNEDLVDTSEDAQMVVLNSNLTRAHNHDTTFTNNAITFHNDSKMIALNNALSGFISRASSGYIVGASNNAKFVGISRKSWVSRAPTEYGAVTGVEGDSLVIIGPTITRTGSTDGASPPNNETNGYLTSTVTPANANYAYFVRTTMTGLSVDYADAGNCWRIGTTGNWSRNVYAYEADCIHPDTAIYVVAAAANQLVNFYGRYMMIGGVGRNIFVGGAGSSAYTTIDITDSIYDSAAANSYRDNATNYVTRDDYNARLRSQNSRSNVYGNSRGFAGTDNAAGSVSLNSTVRWGGAYEVPLDPSDGTLCIPAFVLGQQVCSFRLTPGSTGGGR